ncbi:MAG TPA: tetratricopeptide repeat protein [Gemmatimonadales bacterium]|jgi:tetratricopeptide (TPR) repeat protein
MAAGSNPSSDDPVVALRHLVESGRFEQALYLFDRVWGSGDQADAEVALLGATAATRLGRLELGASRAELARTRFQAAGERHGFLRATNLLGAIAFEAGRLEDAERWFQETLRLAREAENTVMVARASNNLASVAHLRGRPDIALAMYRLALQEYQRAGDLKGIAETYVNIGTAFRQAARWRDAADVEAQAVHHAESLADPVLRLQTLIGRTETELDRADLEQARAELAEAEAYADQLHDEQARIECHRLRSLLALKEGDFLQAAREAEAALEGARATQVPLLQVECLLASAKALRALGRSGEALERRAEAVALVKNLGAGSFLDDLESI